jgi:hypothetical protein
VPPTRRGPVRSIEHAPQPDSAALRLIARLSMDIGNCPSADMGTARWWPLRTAQWRT